MVDRVANSETIKPGSSQDAFTNEEQNALQAALDKYLEQTVVNTLLRIHQQTNNEFNEIIDY